MWCLWGLLPGADSAIDGVSIYGARVRAGEILAETYPVEADVAGSNAYYLACFDGKYPTAIPVDTRKDCFEVRLSQRKNEIDDKD